MAAFPLDPSLLLQQLTGASISHHAGLGSLAFLTTADECTDPAAALDCSSSSTAAAAAAAAPLKPPSPPPLQSGGDRKRKTKDHDGSPAPSTKGRKAAKRAAREATSSADGKGYVHVRARRGQATDSHSLAERVRREKISERMKMLQALVPGCDKVTGKALILDEIINYVQSLQNQVEFLSMRIASMSPVLYGFSAAMDLDNGDHQAQKLAGLFQDPLAAIGVQSLQPHAGGGLGLAVPEATAAAFPQGVGGIVMQQQAVGGGQLLHQMVLSNLRHLQ